MNPTNSNGAADEGILHRRHRGTRNPSFMPRADAVSTKERLKNGNRDGMTTFKHKSIPSAMPFKAVRESKIKIAMAAMLKTIVISRLDLVKTITSADSMNTLAKSSQPPHRISSKEVLP